MSWLKGLKKLSFNPLFIELKGQIGLPLPKALQLSILFSSRNSCFIHASVMLVFISFNPLFIELRLSIIEKRLSLENFQSSFHRAGMRVSRFLPKKPRPFNPLFIETTCTLPPCLVISATSFQSSFHRGWQNKQHSSNFDFCFQSSFHRAIINAVYGSMAYRGFLSILFSSRQANGENILLLFIELSILFSSSSVDSIFTLA